jgi:hypothetical protein
MIDIKGHQIWYYCKGFLPPNEQCYNQFQSGGKSSVPGEKFSALNQTNQQQ